MKRYKRLAGFVLALLMLALALPVLAEEDTAHLTGFTTRAVLPENQIGDASYFHLLALPEIQQIIYVEVENYTDEPLRVHAGIHDAYTSPNGLITYTEEGDEAASGQNRPSVTSIAQIRFDLLDVGEGKAVQAVENDIIKIAPRTRVRIPVEMTFPKEPIEGQLLGGIVITKMDDDEKVLEGDFGVRSIYRYAIALQLQATETVTEEPVFSLKGVQVVSLAGWPGIAVTLENDAPLVVTKAGITLRIIAEGETTPVAEMSGENIAMAPHTTMGYIMTLPGDVKLAQGQYTAQVEWTYAGQTWTMETTFAVQ